MKIAVGIVIVAALLIGGAVLLFESPQAIDIKNDQPAPVAAPPSPKTTTLLFVGDIMLDRHIRKQIEENLDPLYPFLRIAKTLQDADLTIANLEGPISNRGTKLGSIYSFRFEPVGAVNSLQYAGIDVVSLANNHIWDYGRTALLDTFQYLEQVEIGYVGAGRNEIEANAPYLKTINGVTTAFFSYTTLYPKSLWADSENPGISSFDLASAKERVATIKSSGEADFVVLLFHWGEEYQTRSNSSQQEVARALIDAGADLIVGHHPHVAQEVETYESSVILSEAKNLDPSAAPQDAKRIGYIAYSLGNFVFDQNFSADTRKGLLLEVELKGKEIKGVRSIPIVFTDTYQPYIP